MKLTPSLFPSLRRTRLLDEVGAPARNANERLAADVRGQELLRSWLSPEQRRQYDQRGSFEVVGSDTGKRYRICKGDIFNVQESDDRGVQVRARCVTANGVPIGDINLAQKIALETFESEVLRIANRSSVTIWHSAQPALGHSSLRLVDRDLTELCPWLRRCLSIIADLQPGMSKEPPMPTQTVMDHTGDTCHQFDATDQAAVAEAEKRFIELTGAGFTAAKRTVNGTSELIRTFDPTAEETLFIPRLIAG